MLARKLSLYLALAGIAGVALLVARSRQSPPDPGPLVPPARSPYASAVAAAGIVEARRENVRIAAPRPGLVTRVPVAVGDRVQAGAPLFQLDDRDATARIATAEAQIEALRATLAMEEVQRADAQDQFARVLRLEKDGVASEDERQRKQFGLRGIEARLAKTQADIRAAEAALAQARVERDILTVRAPRDGQMLQVNVRAGEYASMVPGEVLMLLGDVSQFQIRADVDEQNAPLVEPDRPAVAFLKGRTENPLALRFVRIEPYVVPKKSLTGDSAERVDTRVLQVIFELDRPAGPLYVGQQVDVFIERTPPPPAAVTRASETNTIR
jgi:multidrug efflux pump subunit AcrA (membrane-fusion protein)